MQFECKIGSDSAEGRVETVEDVCAALAAIITELLRKDVRTRTEGENNVFIGNDPNTSQYVGWYAFRDKF